MCGPGPGPSRPGHVLLLQPSGSRRPLRDLSCAESNWSKQKKNKKKEEEKRHIFYTELLKTKLTIKPTAALALKIELENFESKF